MCLKLQRCNAKQFHVKVAPGLVGLVGEGQLAVQQKA